MPAKPLALQRSYGHHIFTSTSSVNGTTHRLTILSDANEKPLAYNLARLPDDPFQEAVQKQASHRQKGKRKEVAKRFPFRMRCCLLSALSLFALAFDPPPR